MKKMKKSFALLLVFLLLAAMLAGCGSKKCVWCGKSFSGSGHNTDAGYVCDDCYNSLAGGTGTSSKSNTGVWIAVTVMVFIAVFSATSGVVYLVLQKLLPPEKPASRSRVREAEYDYDDFQPPRPPVQRPAAPRPANNPAPRAAGSSGVWICPRDKSRNTGPYCALCGADRPVPPRGSQPSQQAVRGSGQASRPQQNPYTAPQQIAARPQQAAPAQPRQVDTPAYQAPARNTQSDDWQVPVAPEVPEKEYRGRFMRRETTPEPPEPAEVDSDLLATIFREAAENPEEE